MLSHHTPQSEYIQYVEGFLLAPGYIDLSQLRFWASDESKFNSGGGDDDDGSLAGGDDRRFLDEEEPDPDEAEDSHDFGMGGSIVEVAVFHLVRNSVLIQSGVVILLLLTRLTCFQTRNSHKLAPDHLWGATGQI